jgi:hypothetical protein
MAGVAGPGIARRKTAKTSTAAGEAASVSAGAGRTELTNSPIRGTHQHKMSSIPHPTESQVGYQGPNPHTNPGSPPYPTGNEPSSHPLYNHPPREQRQGGYGGYEAGLNEGYGALAAEARPSVTQP